MNPGCLEAHVCVSSLQPYKAGAFVPLLWGGLQEAQRPQVLAWEHTAGHRQARLKAVLQTTAQSCPSPASPVGTWRLGASGWQPARACQRGGASAVVLMGVMGERKEEMKPSLESQVRLCPWAAFRARSCDARGSSKTDPIGRRPADGESVEHEFSRVSGRQVPGPRVRAGGPCEEAGLGTGPGCRQEEVGSFTSPGTCECSRLAGRTGSPL